MLLTCCETYEPFVRFVYCWNVFKTDKPILNGVVWNSTKGTQVKKRISGNWYAIKRI